MARSEATKKITRIQREKTKEILEAALDIFSINGFRGSTIDMIAEKSCLSKTNILYYFDSKESAGHYDKNGKSIKKALMKTPINGARLSSPFGMRKHPIDG